MALTLTELDPGTGLVSFVNALGDSHVKVKGKKVQQIGTPETFLKIYTTIKQAQSLINLKANYIVKDGYFLSSQDENSKAKAEEFFANINVEEVIEMWAKASMIYGNAYLEYTQDNLILRDSRKIFLYIDVDGHGLPVAYVQELGNDPGKFPVFDPTEILVLKNNPIDHLRGLSEFVGIDEIINLDNSAMTDLSAALNRQATRRTHYTIGTQDQPVAAASPKFSAAEESITALLPGEDLITTHEVQSKVMDGGSMGSDFKEYLELLNARMCMQLGVPSDFYFGNSSGPTITERKLVFEQAEIMPRRRIIENIINTQLIPQIVGKTKFPVLFKFGDINTQMSFLESKRQLIELQTGALTPDELRVSKGKDPLGTQAPVQGGQQQIPVSSKDATAQGNIGGNLTGARTNG